MSTHDPYEQPRVRPNGGGTPRWGESVYEGPSRSRSMVDLLRELSVESRVLVRQEVELAKAEMREKVEVFTHNAMTVAGGGVLLLGALMTLLWALNSGLVALFAQGMDVEIAIWLSPVILTLVLGGIGWAMVSRGKDAMAREGLIPRATRETLEEDARWARARAGDVKEEMTHGR